MNPSIFRGCVNGRAPHASSPAAIVAPLVAAVGCFLASAACSATEDVTEPGVAGAGGGQGGSGGSPSSSTSSSGDRGDGGSFGTGGGGSGPVGECTEETKESIYLLGFEKEFYRFTLATLKLTQIGVLDCPGASATAFSMAIDRKGIAWVLYADGHIYHVDTLTAKCTPTAFQPGQWGFQTFGMGFVADAPAADAETLFIADYDGQGLGTLDTTTLVVDYVGPYDTLPGQAAELTGTGDARLFGFFQPLNPLSGDPMTLAEIDKADASILSETPMPVGGMGLSWAFAFWGGDFFLFTGSQIHRYTPATGEMTGINLDVGFSIVGAGVSTCAPVQPPQ